MNCRCCKKKMCLHPLARFENGKKICQVCSKPAEINYLPMRNGRVDFLSDLIGVVCPECYNKHHEERRKGKKPCVAQWKSKGKDNIVGFPPPKK